MSTRVDVLRRMGWALFVLVLVASACSGSGTTTISETTSGDTGEDTAATPVDQEPEPTAEPAATAEPEPEPTAVPVEPTATPEPDPTPAPVYFASELEPGDCFNRLEGNPSFTPPAKVSCDELHEEEVYAKALLDAPAQAPYPGNDALVDQVAAELCDEATITFGGAPWDALPVPTRLLFPSEEEWDAGDRNIMCSATAADTADYKIGSARGGTIITSDVLVSRASLANDGVDFDEWAVVEQFDTINTIGALTDAQFDLPLRRPASVPQGFIFNATIAGAEDDATSTWGYSWETAEFTDLGSILPGQQITSTMVIDGSVIFAARATSGDDYDIWSTAGGDAAIIIGGDGNQQYPTATPDGSKLVYQDNGDIWVANIDGTNPLQLTSGPENDYESVVSPDGGTVVFASDRSGNDDLWAVPIDGGEPTNLTNHAADESWPVFSANGEYIYFASDRLNPEDDRSHLMVMAADGTNQSWFGSTTSSQPIVVPENVAADVLATAPTLNERYSYELLDGEPGTTVSWTHSNGRLTAQIPAGWRIAELDALPGFVAGPRPDTYYEIWEVDGVLVTLWDDLTQDEFFAQYDDVEAVRLCERFDGTEAILPVEGNLLFRSGNFNCGDNAVAGVLMFFDTDTQVGVMIEGQRDNLPSADLDSEMLTAIARSLIWE